MYADFEYYKETYKGSLEEADAVKQLKQASRHIDTLTYNRIVALGYDNLTDFQKDIVHETCCMMADFEYENDSLINNMLTNYSLNGASISINGDSMNACVVSGICVQKDTYSYLQQTGLCCGSLRGC